jgi:TolB protein
VVDRKRLGVALNVVVAGLLVLSGCGWVGRVGVSSAGEQPRSVGIGTFGGDLSTTGRFTVFVSDADNLVPNDTNQSSDVFLRDSQTQVTERVSVADDEAQSPTGGFGGKVSADGRYVAFSSTANNLVAGDTNGAPDGFLRDRVAGTTTRVTLANNGSQALGSSTIDDMTPDARFLVFTSDADNLGPLDENLATDVFVRDRLGPTTRRMSQAAENLGDGIESDADSYGGAISDNGSYVTFISAASTLDPDFDCGCTDVFVRTRTATSVKRVTVTADDWTSDGDSESAVISGDGKWIAFSSRADTLIDPVDSNGFADVYVTARGSGVFQRASDSLEPLDPEDPTSPHDADGDSEVAGISSDGRFVAFSSEAKNLVSQALHAPSNAFVRDRVGATTALAGTTQTMGEPTGPTPLQSGSIANAISGDGGYVLFSSAATDVIGAGDSNGTGFDVFLRSNPVPFIYAASPATVARGATVTVALHGFSLRGAGALALMGDGVTVNSVTPISEFEIDVSVTVAPNAVPGRRTPVILQAGTGVPGFTGGIVFLPDAITIT